MKTAGVILCGGMGRRLGGADKPLLSVLSEDSTATMVAAVAERLTPHVNPLYLSCNRNAKRYQQYGTVITDAPEPSRGPLTGVLRALQQWDVEAAQKGSHAWLLVCPGDTPRLPIDFAVRLMESRGQSKVVVAHDGERRQVLHMLIHSSLREDLQQSLSEGPISVYRWQQRHAPVEVSFSNPAAFLNVNEPGDLAALRDSER